MCSQLANAQVRWLSDRHRRTYAAATVLCGSSTLAPRLHSCAEPVSKVHRHYSSYASDVIGPQSVPSLAVTRLPRHSRRAARGRPRARGCRADGIRRHVVQGQTAPQAVTIPFLALQREPGE